ncbi:MAG: LytTR family DNA-binding domain-containing protein [Candidatus Kryptoniota bacterium]
MHLRTIIVDDEELARKRLRKMLKAYEAELEIVDEARNGEEAVERIDAIRPDVIFLDVQMPGFDGFEVVRRLKSKPHIVFATAYDEFALKAFEENTVDYLLKPIDEKRLDKAIDKLRQLFNRQSLRLDENVERLLARLAAAPMKRMQVRVGDKIILVDIADVVYFEAKDKYTYLHTADQEYIVDLTLGELESKLDAMDFVRIHRSTIINLKHMLELVKWFGGKYKVRLKDKNRTELVVSRGYVDRIHRL